MRSMASIVGLLVTLGGGYSVYHSYFKSTGLDTTPPQEQIDVVGVRSQLLVIGQAERTYVVAHSAYGTLEQLQQDGPPSIGAPQRGYTFSVSPNGSKASATT